MIGFQQFRFVNVSNVRARILDLTIEIPPLHDRKVGINFRSTQNGKSKYQRDIEAMHGSNDSPHRMLAFIDFPLRIEPSQMIEGQICIDIPDDKAPDLARVRAPLMNEWMDIQNMKFKIRDHISGREVTLKLGDQFDATNGTLTTQIVYPKRFLWRAILSRFGLSK